MERFSSPVLQKFLICLGVLPLLGFGPSMKRDTKVILLGMDGLDPKVLERLAAAGDLPHFKSLMEAGSYRKLATVVPSESPVAWSTLATGANPGKHGIFGFIHRDPKTYMPALALYGSSKFSIQSSRGGTPFWQVSSSNKIPTNVIRFPITFPPEKVYGRMLSGMGVPDLQGSLGLYSFFTTDRQYYQDLKDHDSKGTLFLLETAGGKVYQTQILGPRVAGPFSSEPRDISIPLQIETHPRQVMLKIGDSNYSIREGQWSEWIPLKFPMSFMKTTSGIGRFYLVSAEPLKLYLSAIQIDPKDPEFAISYPEEFSSELAEKIGYFHTLGMPEDTNAFVEGVLSQDVFLEQVETIMKEREKMLVLELQTFKEGLLVFVFDEPDRMQHVFWKEGREKPIDDCYKRLDKILGSVIRQLDEKTILVLVSDHGFTSFKTNVHLNTWLKEKGYLALLPGREESENFFSEVDWSKTKAYSLGLNGLYLNLKGREKMGIVEPGDAQKLKQKIEKDFLEFRDANGKNVVRRVFWSDKIYAGPFRDSGPDMLLGMNEGFRISQQTALGGVPRALLEANVKKWSGDHVATDPDLVPGVFLSNRKFKEGPVSLMDVAPTLLEIFGCSVPESMDGKPLLLLR